MTSHSYHNPAVIEAVFELRFAQNSKWGMDSIVRFANAASERGYPDVQDTAEGFQINFGPFGEQPEFRPANRRIQTWNKERTQLWQASAELFAANRRAPYEGWGKFRPHIAEGFRLYQKLAKPKKANAMALQYVNRIEIDEEHPAKDYLVFSPPEVRYADTMKALACNSQEAFRDGDMITLTAGLNLTKGDPPVMILNLVYTSPLPPLKEQELLKRVDRAHNRIIAAFEKSITDKLRDRMGKI